MLVQKRFLVEVHHRLELVVHDQHDRRPNRAEGVGSGALEEGGGALLLDDLGEAVAGSLVQPLRRGLQQQQQQAAVCFQQSKPK